MLERKNKMEINTDNLISVTKANQNFSEVARLVDEKGSVVVLKHNKPKYLLMEYEYFKRHFKKIKKRQSKINTENNGKEN